LQVLCAMSLQGPPPSGRIKHDGGWLMKRG
jgi:hypothetical protein